MLVPVMLDPWLASGPANPFAATMSVPGAATSGFERPSRVGPWLLVMLIRLEWLVEVRHRDRVLAAGERRDRCVVDIGSLREERREAQAALPAADA